MALQNFKKMFQVTPFTRAPRIFNTYAKWFNSSTNKNDDIDKRHMTFLKGLKGLSKLDQMNEKEKAEIFVTIFKGCTSESDTDKYRTKFEELKIQPTKEYYTSLIRAYAYCNSMQKAKEVVVENTNMNYTFDIKSELVSALVKGGYVSEATRICNELQDNLAPRAAIHMTRYVQTQGELGRLLEYLRILEKRPKHEWYDGCSNIILYCTRNRMLSESVDLVRKLADMEISNHEVILQMLSVIAEKEPADMDFGLKLYAELKDDTQDFTRRMMLDLLQSACLFYKDKSASDMVWREYAKKSLNYNAFTRLKRFHTLLAVKEIEEAHKCSEKIGHPNVSHIIKKLKAFHDCT